MRVLILNGPFQNKLVKKEGGWKAQWGYRGAQTEERTSSKSCRSPQKKKISKGGGPGLSGWRLKKG